MRKRLSLFWAVLTLAGAAGCTDTWAGYGREERNLKNELADYMVRIVDEETAKDMQDGEFSPAEKLKRTWEDHKHRFEGFLKGHNLGSFKNMVLEPLQRAAPGQEVKEGYGNTETTYKKDANGVITVESKAKIDEDKQDVINTLSSPGYMKAMEAAEQRLKDQVERIKRLVPQGPFLQKAAGLPKQVFN